MPELPEVEVTRRGIAPHISGARIEAASLGKPLRWPLGVPVQTLVGRTVQAVRRRGKYLLLDLDEGLLLLHLGMSGRLCFAPQLPPLGVHDHFQLVTSRGILRLTDPRRFGAVVWAADAQAPVVAKLLGRLGVEPFSPDFTPAQLRAGLQRHRAAIKPVLLAGEVVVGAGNIYACEALFQAGIRPTAKAASLSLPRVTRLHAALCDVLSRAVTLGGSTLKDFSNADGQAGYFQLEAAVYGRAGQPCRVCGDPVRVLRQGQRSTFFCPTCQRN